MRYPFQTAAIAALFFFLLDAAPSRAVTAVDDFLLAVENRSIEITHQSLQANDQIEPKGAWSVVLDSEPHGILWDKGDSFAYVPPPGFTGIDSFRYHLTSEAGSSNEATVRIHVGAYYSPVLGDWLGEGRLQVGVFVNHNPPYFLLCESRDENPLCPQYVLPASFRGMLPVAGNWDADPVDEVGLYNPATAELFLRDIGPDHTLPALRSFRLGSGGKGNVPLAGDWDGNGVATVGLRLAQDGAFWLPTETLLAFDYQFKITGSLPSWRPFAGDWNHDGAAGVALYDPLADRLFLRNDLTTGPPQVVHPGLREIDPEAVPVGGYGESSVNINLFFFNASTLTFYFAEMWLFDTWLILPSVKVIVPTDPDGVI